MGQLLDAVADRAATIEAAVAALRAGELVVLPTDTLYGVAADAFNPAATAKLFAAKRRSRDLPLPVLIRSPKQLLGLLEIVPREAERLMAAYWPGPLTIVVPSDPNLSWDLGEAQGTVAVRMPMDDVTLDIIRGVGPLAVTSANLSGSRPSPTAAGARTALGDAVAVYVDAGRRSGRGASTIVDLTTATPGILREGPLPADEVIEVALGTRDMMDVTVIAPPADSAAAVTRADLLALPGIGSAKADALLAAFPGGKGLRGASAERLAKVAGISAQLADRLARDLG